MAAPALAPVADDGRPRPLVSVVMPTYRRPHQIGDTIASLRAQTCGDFELLVRDDSPNDETERVVAAIPDARIRYHRNVDRLGMPGNLNAGIAETRGEFIAVCHDHDLYEPKFLETLVGLFRKHPDLTFAHSGLSMIREDGTPTGTGFVYGHAEWTDGKEWLRFMLTTYSCPVPADALVPRAVHEKHGLYDPDYGFISDVELWMRLSVVGAAGYAAESLINVREREADHEYFEVNWDLIDRLLRIHRRYLPQAYSGSALAWKTLCARFRKDRYLSMHYLYCVKRKDSKGQAAGRRFLRRNGGVFSRALSLVPF